MKSERKMSWIRKSSLIVLFALVIHEKGECDAARILGLFPLPGKSHYVMCETLMRGLAARGHQVDVISHFPLKNPPPNWRDISLHGTIPTPVNNVTLKEAEGFSGGSMERLMYMGGTQVCSLLKNSKIRDIIENPPTDPPYDLVINELFVSDCFLAFARHLKVPMVGMVTNKLFDWMNLPLGNPGSTAYIPSLFSGLPQRMSFLQRLQNTLLSGAIKAQYWYYVSSQLTIVEEQFGIKVSSISELYKDISIMLVNTHPSFDLVRPMTPGVVEVGGLHVTDGYTDFSPEVKKWLDGSKDGCVYVSFGSMVKIESFPKETLRAFYSAFERIAPVRILMKIANPDELPAGLPKNVMTSPWLPQTRVLQHKNVKIFVTHGGLMSTQEAITFGKPIIAFPIFGDQHLNAQLCEQRKVAISMNYREVTADSFAKSLNEILMTSSYSENAKALSKLWIDRPTRAIDTAIFWVEYTIRNGNVLRSPAVDLTWWQVELLDVYGFLIFTGLLALYIIYRVIRLVLRLACSKLCKNQRSRVSAAKSKKNK